MFEKFEELLPLVASEGSERFFRDFSEFCVR